MLEFAAPPAGRRRSLVRLAPRDRHVLVPSRVAFEPPADVYVTEDAVLVRLEIAGLHNSFRSINVSIRDDLLTISGERPDPAAGAARQYDQMEIQTGCFQRTLRLPCPVDETAAVARYDDGYLTVKLPKLIRPRTGTLIVAIE
jgi:HSP20 family protein